MTPGSVQALQRALNAATNDPSARAGVIAALRSAEVIAATWPTDPATLRTLTNSNGVTALAIFSDEEQLREASVRYAWQGIDGKIPSKRLHISEAIRFARVHRAQLVVIDIASDDMFELDEGEMELLGTMRTTRPPTTDGMPPIRTSRPPPPGPLRPASSRPPAKGDSAVFPASKSQPADSPKSQPASAPKSQPAQRPGTSRPPKGVKLNDRPDAVVVPPAAPAPSLAELAPTDLGTEGPAHASSATAVTVRTGTITGALQVASGLVLSAIDGLPPDKVLDALTHSLRDFPEVEWGCLVRAGKAGAEAVPTIALRVDPAFRKNLNEISVRVRETAVANGVSYEVLMLESQEQMKLARHVGKPFYPWRKK